MIKKPKNIFIVGSKGIPANYGGFETFVENLTKQQVSDDIRYHVACLDEKEYVEEYNGANCFHLKVPHIGPAKAIYYDLAALRYTLDYIDSHYYAQNGIVYILACRIGPWMKKYVKQFHQRGYKVYVNPDGHEFLRAKWNYFIKKYWKFSEKLMVKHADLLICDSENIESYIQDEYKKNNPKTTYISYGAYIADSEDAGNYQEWIDKFNIKKDEYFLIVGRFVPENNYETMIREFMNSNTQKDLVIITDYQNKLYKKLNVKLNFQKDKRIKFVGTVYDEALLKTIRKNAFAYLHGHEVGGTNPSLLEALGTTKLNLLLNVGFNQEVGLDSCIYWGKEKNNLKHVIEHVETFDQSYIDELGKNALDRVKNAYNWPKIIKEYEDLFIK